MSKEIKYNIVNQGCKTITILFGMHGKYLFKDFKRNNIQLIGDWYLAPMQNKNWIDELVLYFQKFDPTCINLVGTSKSCTGAFIFAQELSSKFSNIEFNVFGFSAYTTLDRGVYEKNDILKYAPSSLSDIWNHKLLNKLAIENGGIESLLNKSNINIYLLYPSLSNGLESFMVKRVLGPENVTPIPRNVSS